MKIQDIIFFIVLAFLLFRGNPRLLVISGLLCLVFAIPLFATWTFFTAERFTWYAAAFFSISIILMFLRFDKKSKIKDE